MFSKHVQITGEGTKSILCPQKAELEKKREMDYVYQFTTAVNKLPQTGWLKTRHLFSHSSGARLLRSGSVGS